MDPDRIIRILRDHRFNLNNEKNLQQEIAEVLQKYAPDDFVREYRFDRLNIVDFFFYTEGVAIEVKLSGSAKTIYRQCERYCRFPEVKSLILLTNKAMGFPETLESKNCYVLNLGKAWL